MQTAKVRAFGAIGLGLLLAARCDDAALSDPPRSEQRVPSAVTVDSTGYRLQNGVAEVAVRFTNSSQSVAFVDRCGREIDWHAERLDGGEWHPVGGDICFAIAVPPAQVAPGASLLVPVRLFADPLIAREQRTGTFRIRLSVYSQLDGDGQVKGPAWPADSTTSPHFTIAP
jgi:hypothetical protein